MFLRQQFPNHIVLGTFDISHVRAGTILFISTKFAHHTLNYDNINNDATNDVAISPHTIERGRCMAVSIRIGQWKSCFVNVHVEPNLPTLHKHRLFNKISRYLKNFADHVAFFLGISISCTVMKPDYKLPRVLIAILIGALVCVSKTSSTL